MSDNSYLFRRPKLKRWYWNLVDRSLCHREVQTEPPISAENHIQLDNVCFSSHVSACKILNMPPSYPETLLTSRIVKKGEIEFLNSRLELVVGVFVETMLACRGRRLGMESYT